MERLMSHYSRYVSERLGWHVIEVEAGFIAYSLVPPNAAIEELYIVPECRRSGLAQRLGAQVEKIAIEQGCKVLWTQARLDSVGADYTVAISLKYGFKLASADGGRIIMRKEIGG